MSPCASSRAPIDWSYRATHALVLLRLGRVEEARPLVAGLLADGWDDAELLELAQTSGLAVSP